LGKLIFKTCDLNISISKAVQNFVYKFDKRESPIIYRGLEINDIEKIKPDLEIKEKYEDKTIISFVGRLYKWKGVENTVKAIKSLPKGIKQKIIFLIIGDGEDYNRIKNTIKSKDPIKMLGNLPREEAIGILKKSDIYVHSSLPGGGLSTSLLEAMYCGCSIIATPYEGANEIIKNNINGILISANGKIQNNIANSILKIINHRDNLKKLQSNAKKDIANKFKWNNSIKKYEKIFKN
jgi:glycosyltransferase involved in cell wall biosynthesis